MTPRRHHDWRPRLVACLAAAARAPFEMGVNDCALFAADAVAAMTGHDPAAGFRGRYSTMTGGLRVARRAGFADHVEAFARLFEEIPPAFAAAGDLAVVAGPDGPAMGLVQGASIYVFGPGGIAFVPLLSAARAFRVP